MNDYELLFLICKKGVNIGNIIFWYKVMNNNNKNYNVEDYNRKTILQGMEQTDLTEYEFKAIIGYLKNKNIL